MLYRIPKNSTSDTPTIGGQYLAKNKEDKRARAQLAADIVNGNVKIGDLTVSQAARLCRVERKYVVAARKPLAAPESLAEHFARSTPDEWRECARTIGPAIIWDRMIAPLV